MDVENIYISKRIFLGIFWDCLWVFGVILFYQTIIIVAVRNIFPVNVLRKKSKCPQLAKKRVQVTITRVHGFPDVRLVASLVPA